MITKKVQMWLDKLDYGQSHSALAREILEADSTITSSHRTLRRNIAQHRGTAEQIPSKLDFSHLPKPYTKGKKENVLIIGDPHEPFTREGYMLHCREMQEKYECGTVVNIGDVVDNHYSSYHEADPDGLGAGDELDQAVVKVRQWHYLFPNAYVCIGNHDDIIRRQLYSNGISARWLKSMNEVLGTPTWKWGMEHEIYGVKYIHGTGTTGANAAYTRAMKAGQSVVMGHIHTEASVKWHVTKTHKVFGLITGCGVDDRTYAMAYAKNFPAKYIVSCAVVLEKGTVPIVLPMNL
jgi:hypothetical protein